MPMLGYPSVNKKAILVCHKEHWNAEFGPFHYFQQQPQSKCYFRMRAMDAEILKSKLKRGL
jgi:hypothetical protein